MPDASHKRPETLSADGLVVRHYNAHNRVREYDFSTLPVTEKVQRSLAALFAAQCRAGRWNSHDSSESPFQGLRAFATFLSQLEDAPRDLDELSAAQLKRWRVSQSGSNGGYYVFTSTARLLRGDARLQSGPVAEELARRMRKPKSRVQSYREEDFDHIKLAARRQFRAALLRIEDNARHLQHWREGAFEEGSRPWLLGEALDVLARTGDVPRYKTSDGQRTVISRYQEALGGVRSEVTWQRLFLTRLEAMGLGVLLMSEYGWNQSVIDNLEVPRASPDPGNDGNPTYRIPLDKPRAAANRYETRNVTDDGADSKGRLITQALAATRFARACVEEHAPGSNRLVVWRSKNPGRPFGNTQRLAPVGPFCFGIERSHGSEWARSQGLKGSPFQRGRRTVTAVDRREPLQHRQDTHDMNYALVDERVRAEAVEVIAAGAEEAADRARRAVLTAQIGDAPAPGDVPTATADCSDFDHSPHPPAPDGGCGASFLACLGCENARVHPGHHPRLVHLHQSLTNLRSVLPQPLWDREWAEPHARLEDLQRKLGDGAWKQAKARVTNDDRYLIDLLLTGSLDT
ncbi:hypothetical protein [Streptomyces globisporus]|uniref:hypothetical protein n=1 Tax=Streptomyces globisporus TaxID=1908 RepID=UPI00381AF1DA